MVGYRGPPNGPTCPFIVNSHRSVMTHDSVRQFGCTPRSHSKCSWSGTPLFPRFHFILILGPSLAPPYLSLNHHPLSSTVVPNPPTSPHLPSPSLLQPCRATVLCYSPSCPFSLSCTFQLTWLPALRLIPSAFPSSRIWSRTVPIAALSSR